MIKQAAGKLTILSIGPPDESQARLERILVTTSGLRTVLSPTLHAALPLLQKGGVPVVLCDRDDNQVVWKQLLEQVGTLKEPPYVIVTSRLADDRLWSEALNLGAYDVLAKPFEASEVTRVLASARLRWEERYRTSTAVRCGGAATACLLATA